MSKRKDYYKILGIDKSSSEQQIKKAYRKLALKLHPDKEPDPEKKASSEKKFKEVADAYEVLMDPEKKARFDNGEDLNEPPQQVCLCRALQAARPDLRCSRIPSPGSAAAASPSTSVEAALAAYIQINSSVVNPVLRRRVDERAQTAAPPA
jgi:curved DNA-binding protein CbpA